MKNVRRLLCLLPFSILLPSSLRAQAPTSLGGSSLFNDAAGQGLIARRTATKKGDLLTVRVRQVMKGSYSASTNTSKTEKGTLNATSLPLFDIFAGPVVGNILGSQAGLPQRLLKSLTGAASTGGSETFVGSGNTLTAGDFSATLSVLVTDVEHNGNLRVEGFSFVRVNKEVQRITLTGVVRLDDVAPDNTVASEKIANVDLKADGKGAVAGKTRQGILGKILGWLL